MRPGRGPPPFNRGPPSNFRGPGSQPLSYGGPLARGPPIRGPVPHQAPRGIPPNRGVQPVRMTVQPKKRAHEPPRDNETVLYVANISEKSPIPKEKLIHIFEKYGPVHHIDMKDFFCFVEYENSGDAKKALAGLQGVDIAGRRMSVRWSKRRVVGLGRLQGNTWWDGQPGGRREKNQIIVANIPQSMTNQDLLNLAWEAGHSVVHVSLRGRSTDNTYHGLIEYAHIDDMIYAKKHLDGIQYKDKILRLFINEPGKAFHGLKREVCPSPPPPAGPVVLKPGGFGQQASRRGGYGPVKPALTPGRRGPIAPTIESADGGVGGWRPLA